MSAFAILRLRMRRVGDSQRHAAQTVVYGEHSCRAPGATLRASSACRMTCHNQPATTGAAQTSLARPAFRGGTHLHTQPAGPSDPSALRPVHRGSHEIPVTSLQQTPRTPGSDPRTFRQDTRPRGPDKQLHPAGAQAAPHPGCPGTRTGPAGWPLAPLSASRPTGARVTSADVPKPALPRLLGTPVLPTVPPTLTTLPRCRSNHVPRTIDLARRRRDDGLPLQRVENHQPLRRRIGALSGYSPAMERVADPPDPPLPAG